MDWSSEALGIPHVFERIFAYLQSSEELLSAAAVCRSWERVIFESRSLPSKLALNVVRKGPDGVQQVLRENRRAYRSVIVAPTGDIQSVMNELFEAVSSLNERRCIRNLRINGISNGNIVSPLSIRELSCIAQDLRSLDLTMNTESYMESDWSNAFQHLTKLKSLALTGGHLFALKSAHHFCRKLRKLTIKRFTLGKSLFELINFPRLELLSIEDMDIEQSDECTQVVLPSLKHLTISMSLSVVVPNYLLTKIIAPKLVNLRTTDLLGRAVQIVTGASLRTISFIFVDKADCWVSPFALASVKHLIIERYCVNPRELYRWIEQNCPSINRLSFKRLFCDCGLVNFSKYGQRILPSLTHVYNEDILYWTRQISRVEAS